MEMPMNTDLALAIEHMKNHQLTLLNASTDGQRQGYALVAKAALELNKILLAKLYSLENSVLHATHLGEASELVTDVRLYTSREMERLVNEWNVQCNSERADNDPRKVALTPGVYIKDGSINEYTGFN
ncbi:hypothetical protein BZ973_00645 [Salmonella enterica subsp. enterica serovar Enteritidis]|uniref:Uncharacterized protein n=1 Tax=Salmonella enteritidis TaxID=149539 RepID=A0A5W4PTY4_SALEN|nr:hypothetical protein [Salmonella enterica subsp. enterica serovar Enteritidis]EBW9188239.1 hypothetical protein [Salmonella enterica subsp. enterica serovar Enteritidis]